MRRYSIFKKVVSILICVLLLFGCIYSFNINADEETETQAADIVVEETAAEETTAFEETAAEETTASEETAAEETTASEETVEEITTAEETRETIPEETQVNYPAFEQSADAGDFIVKVTAAEGVFPEGSTLLVTPVNDSRIKAGVDEAVSASRDAEKNVAISYTLDIKVLDAAGQEVQPADYQKVNVSFSAKEVANVNLETEIYHIEESDYGLSAQPLESVTEGDTTTVETDGFSYYTVEFTYEGKQFVLQGYSMVNLDNMLSEIGLFGEVESYEVSAPELFNVFVGDETGISYEYDNEEFRQIEAYGTPVDNPEGHIKYLAALKPFSSTEWLDVTIDGVKYRIIVTDTYIDDITGNDLSDRVIVDGDINDFTKSMPLATIFIDEDIVNTNLYRQGSSIITVEKLSTSTDFVLNTTSTGENYGRMMFKGTLRPNQDNFYSGDIARYTIKDAAEYTDASGQTKKADVVITYSDMHLVIQNNASAYTPQSGREITLFDTNRIYPAFYDSSGNTRLGMKVDVNVKVVDENGDLVPGKFIYPMIDIDTDRSTNANFGRLYDAANNRNYSEQVAFKGGFEDRIWIPDTFIEGVTTVDRTEEGDLLVYPKVSDQNTFNSGFITLANNTAGGISITQTSTAALPGSAYSNGVESYILTGSSKVNIKVAESTDIGGNISASSKDYGENIEPDGKNQKRTIVAAKGQTVVFTMTPEPGYRIKNIYVSTSDLDILEAVQRREATPISMNDPHLAKKSGGVYQYIMSTITNEESIHVEWEPVNKLRLTKEAIGDGVENFDFEIRVTKGDKYYDLENQEEKDSEYINTVSVKAGHTREWIIPDGWSYEIEEVSLPDNWQLTHTENASGIIEDEDVNAVFTNRELFDLVINKNTVEDEAGTFKFKIKIWDDESGEFLDLSKIAGLSPVSGEEGTYEFELDNGGSITIPKVPYEYQYEVMEKTQDGWRLVMIDKTSSTKTTLKGKDKYKVEIEDLDLETIEVIEEKDVEVYYKSYTEGALVKREVVPVNAEDNNLLRSHFPTVPSELDAGKEAIVPDSATESFEPEATVGTVNLSVTDNNGNVQNSGNIIARRASSESNYITVEDLSTITPDVRVNGNTQQQTGDHFQKDGTKIRLRYSTDGKINQLNEDKKESYNDVVTLRYPNAAKYTDIVTGDITYYDVLITITDINLFIPTNVNADNNFKGAIFDYGDYPIIYAKIMGTGTHKYGVTEKINIKVEGAPEGSTFVCDIPGIDDPGDSVIKDADLHNNFDAQIDFTSGVVRTIEDHPQRKKVLADAKNGLSFNATIPGYGKDDQAAAIGILLESSEMVHAITATSDPFTVEVIDIVTEQVVTKEDDHYIVDLDEGQSITIPDGKPYKIYKDDGAGNWILYKDSEDASSTVYDPESSTVDGIIESDTSVTYENSKDKDLTIEKSTDEDGEFKFDVKVWKEIQDEDPVYLDLTEYGGTAQGDYFYRFEITTDGGEGSLTIENLPRGYKYEVVEVERPDYVQRSKIGDTGELTEDKTASFRNRLKRGTITVSKETVDDVAGEFEFNVKIWKEATYLDLSTYGGTPNGDGSYKFKINNGESFTINNIPYGYQYDVAEASKERWVLRSVTGDTSGSILSETPYEMTFTNEQVNKLDITKNVTGNQGDKEDKFNFTAVFTKGGDPFVLEVVPEGVSGSGGTYTFTLGHAQTVLFEQIPNGVSYTVTEDDYSSKGYTTTVDGSGGRAASGTFNNADASHTFANNRKGVVPTEVFVHWWMWLFLLVPSAGYIIFRLIRKRRS